MVSELDVAQTLLFRSKICWFLSPALQKFWKHPSLVTAWQGHQWNPKPVTYERLWQKQTLYFLVFLDVLLKQHWQRCDCCLFFCLFWSAGGWLKESHSWSWLCRQVWLSSKSCIGHSCSVLFFSLWWHPSFSPCWKLLIPLSWHWEPQGTSKRLVS